MTNNILTIMKKEFARFFRDRRMVLTTIIMPGLMIYLLYSFIGQGLSAMIHPEDQVSQVYVENLPQSIQAMEANLNVKFIPTTDTDDIKKEIEAGTEGYDLLVIFPENFDAEVAAYDIASGQPAPNIEIYYNSTVTASAAAYQLMTAALDAYESSLANKFDINRVGGPFDLASERDQTGQVFSLMIPLLMLMFLFSACMAVAPESIAGEKERGTIATLLVTPLRRRDLALGKILSLSTIAILSGASSFIGVMLSIPKMMGDVGAESGIDAGVYAIGDYFLLLVLILSTVLVIITLISIVSALAKTVKEATTWVTPLMILVMLIGVSSMVPAFRPTSALMFMIPLYNSVQCMSQVFSFSYQTMDIVITVVSNIVFAAIGVVVLARMFSSERVMFSK